MKKLLVGVILGLTLNGCATQSNYKALLDTWVGGTEDQLVNSWGPPNGLYNKPDGGKILTFAWSGSYYLPGDTSTSSSSTYDGVVTTTTTVSPGSYITTGCKTNFYILDYFSTLNFTGLSSVSHHFQHLHHPTDLQQAQHHSYLYLPKLSRFFVVASPSMFDFFSNIYK